MTLNIYNANTYTTDIIEFDKLYECYNKFENISAKTNEEIITIQNTNKEEKKKFITKTFAISFSKRDLFFKPRMTEWGSASLNFPLEDNEFKQLLTLGENFKNYIFNNCLALTDKMPECIDMGIDDPSMKHKLKFRESMPEYEYNESDMDDEQYHRIYNMITVKKSEKYGISPTLSVNIQQMSFLKDIYNNEFPPYFESKPNMKKLIHENNKYLVTDFKYLTPDGPKDKTYDFMSFLEIKKLVFDLHQDLDEETQNPIIKKLEQLITEFDSKHWTFERFNTYMEKRRKHSVLGLEISPNKILCSNFKFEKLYGENPLYSIQEYIENNVFYNKFEEYIVGKKEVDRDGKISISKSKKSRDDFYMKLIVFDETSLDKPVAIERPDYFSRADEQTDTQVTSPQTATVNTFEPEPEPEFKLETKDEEVEVPDSDDEQ
jgi:hypothetical protein